MSLKQRIKSRLKAVEAAWSDDETSVPRAVLATTGAAGGAIGDVVEAVTPDIIQQAGTEVANAFGVPKLFEMIPEEYQDEATDVADSLNLLGAGGLGSSMSRHGILSGMKNYIPGYYGAGRAPVNKMEGMLSNKGIPLEAQRKVTGGAQWGAQSAMNALENTLMPGARAQLKDTGIPKHVSRQMQGGKKNFFDTEIDNAQILYQKHADVQSGRHKGLMPAAEELVNRQTFQKHSKYEPGATQKAMRKYDSPDSPLSKADYDFMEKWVDKGQDLKKGDNLVIKANRGAGGNHYNDVLVDSQVVPPLYAAFKKLNKQKPDGFTKADLKAEMEVLQAKNRQKIKDLPKKQRNLADWYILDNAPGDNAIWLTGGRVGTAKTEGGIPFLIKVDTDGNMSGIMADTHDMGEKLPGVKQLVKEKVVATNAPMHHSIYSLRKQLGKEVKVPSAQTVTKAKQVEGVPLKVDPKTGKEKPGISDIMLREAIGKAKPTKETLRKERLRSAATVPLLFESLIEDEE